MKELLERHGIKATSCNEGSVALDIFCKKGDFDGIITDLRMPGMSGQTFIAEIRKFEKESKRVSVPIIIVTAENEPTEKLNCLNSLGANEYLLKPIKLQDLLISLSKLFSGEKKAGKNILVIEDEAISSTIIAKILSNQGHKPFVSGQILQAKEIISREHNNLDLILLDNLLPDGTGKDFLEFLEEHEKNLKLNKIPIVSMSGNSIDEQKEHYEGFEIKAFFQKPLRMENIKGIALLAK